MGHKQNARFGSFNGSTALGVAQMLNVQPASASTTQLQIKQVFSKLGQKKEQPNQKALSPNEALRWAQMRSYRVKQSYEIDDSEAKNNASIWTFTSEKKNRTQN